MPDDRTGAHAARIHRHDLVVGTRKAALVPGDELRIEGRLTIARDLQLDPSGLGRHRLAAVAIAAAAVAGLRRSPDGNLLGVQVPVGQRLLQIVEQAVGVERRLGIGPGQQLVRRCVRDTRSFASYHRD